MNLSQQSVSHIVVKYNTMWQNNVKILKLTDVNTRWQRDKRSSEVLQNHKCDTHLSNDKTFDVMHQTDLFFLDCSVINDHDAKKSFTFVLPQEHTK